MEELLEMEPSEVGREEASPRTEPLPLLTSAFSSPARSAGSSNPANSLQTTISQQSFSEMEGDSLPPRNYDESFDNSLLASPPRLKKASSAALSTTPSGRASGGAFSTPSQSSAGFSNSGRDSPPAHVSPLEQLLDTAWDNRKMSPCRSQDNASGREDNVPAFVGKDSHVQVEELLREAIEGHQDEETKKAAPMEEIVEPLGVMEEPKKEESAPVEEVDARLPVEVVNVVAAKVVEEPAQVEGQVEEMAPDQDGDDKYHLQTQVVKAATLVLEDKPPPVVQAYESVVQDKEPEAEAIIHDKEPVELDAELETKGDEEHVAEVHEEKPEPDVPQVEPDLVVKKNGPELEVYEVDHEREKKAEVDDHQPTEAALKQLEKATIQGGAPKALAEKSKSPPRAPADDCTPRVSNHECKNLSEGRKSRQDDRASSVSSTQSPTRSSVSVSTSQADWSAQAVESMSDALKRLRNFAAPYIKDQMSPSTSEPELPPVMEKTPKMVDTSLESLYRDNDKESEYHTDDLDLTALVKEIRPPKDTVEEKEENERQTYSKVKSLDHQKIHPAFSQSTDSMGQPKPPQLKATTPAVDLTKPVPMKFPRSAEEILQPDPDELPPSGHNKTSRESLTPPENAAPVGSSRVRSMTPIMRMRAPEEEDDVLMNKAEEEKVEKKTEEEIKAEKQRKWKERRKLVEKKREKERRKLSGNKSSKSRKKEKSKGKRVKHRGHRDTSSVVQCQTGIQNLFDKLVDGRCGDIADTLDETYDTDDRSDNSRGSYITESDEEESVEERIQVKKVVEPGSPIRQEYDERQLTKSCLAESNLSDSLVTESRLSDSSLSDSRIGSVARYNLSIHDAGRVAKDKGFIKSFIAGATKYGTELYLHKKQRKQAVSKASKVIAYLRLSSMGNDALFDAPRLEWMAQDDVPAGSVPLFDIRSLDKATALQLEKYPLAMPGRSLFLRTSRGTDYVFEASDEEAAVRFVHGMRWVIARLSFNLIIGNFSVSCELLDFPDKYNYKGEPKSFPENAVEETRWTRAMNDVSNHLVDSSTVGMAV